MNLLTSPRITWQSRNTFINIYSIITKNYNFLSMTALGYHYGVYYRKMLYDTRLIERSRRTSNPAGRSSRISNSAGRLLCVTWFELFSQLATPGRSYARKIRNHSCGGPVEWKKRAYERILTFGTAQSNTPSNHALGYGDEHTQQRSHYLIEARHHFIGLAWAYMRST